MIDGQTCYLIIFSIDQSYALSPVMVFHNDNSIHHEENKEMHTELRWVLFGILIAYDGKPRVMMESIKNTAMSDLVPSCVSSP